MWFDPYRKFGIDCFDYNETTVNLYADYDTASKELKMIYTVNAPHTYEDHIYEPTDDERKTVISMMQEMCQSEYKCSMEDFVRQENEREQNMG